MSIRIMLYDYELCKYLPEIENIWNLVLRRTTTTTTLKYSRF